MGSHVVDEAPGPDGAATSRGQGSTYDELRDVCFTALEDLDLALVTDESSLVLLLHPSCRRSQRSARRTRPAAASHSILTIAIIASRTRPDFTRIGVAHQFTQQRRNDLPREAEAVLQPPTLTRFTAVTERGPVVVDLVLIAHKSRTSENASLSANVGPPFMIVIVRFSIRIVPMMNPPSGIVGTSIWVTSTISEFSKTLA